jgi:N-acetylglucosaminyldiphosphoundecaprenol N-acetyl-beta-D-mannosaminyltransferase
MLNNITQASKLRYFRRIQLLNIGLDNISFFELLRSLKKGIVLTPNVDHLMQLQSDRDFLQIYNQAEYRICDSQVLLYASRFLGTPLKQKISGSDFFPAFCNFHRSHPEIKIFLLGGSHPEQAADRINHRIGREIIVGTYSPPFGFEQDTQECLDIVKRIQQSGATVVAVGLGAPKQEKWIYHYKDRLPTIDIFLAIGATIDFEAGDIKRSPRWVSRAGLEWLYRLLSEPRRLWKRYLIRDLPFLWLILQQKLGRYILSHHSLSSLNRYDEQYQSRDAGHKLTATGRHGKP